MNPEPSPLRPDWAPKVAQHLIRRLYETDARGIIDEELIAEVGYALSSRCRSIVQATENRVQCPQCQHAFATAWKWHKRGDSMQIRCPACQRWAMTGRQYRQAIEQANVAAAGAITVFQRYVAQFPETKEPRQRMILIDRLIHAFHWGLRQHEVPHRSTANNLIEGSHEAVVRFLDQLSYGAAITPELQATHRAWQPLAQTMLHQREQGWRKGES